jgi:hypothetical protein
MPALLEQWRPVVGYEGLYEVSNTGRVFSIKRGHELTARCSNKSRGGKYRLVVLFKNQVAKSFLIHRLVASAFVDNPDGKTQVNHIDGDGTNNNASNLEWVTPSENCLHRYRVLRSRHPMSGRFGGAHPRAKAVVVDGVRYPSVADAATQLGLNRGALQSAAYRGTLCSGLEVSYATP